LFSFFMGPFFLVIAFISNTFNINQMTCILSLTFLPYISFTIGVVTKRSKQVDCNNLDFKPD
jgi:hypothetical protein